MVEHLGGPQFVASSFLEVTIPGVGVPPAAGLAGNAGGVPNGFVFSVGFFFSFFLGIGEFKFTGVDSTARIGHAAIRWWD
jgi:hypothetical protein